MLQRILLAVVAALGLCAFAFWFLFGTLSPCDALRAEYKRQGEEKAGVLGKAIMGLAGEINVDGMAPLECTQRAMRLRFGNKTALDDLTK